MLPFATREQPGTGGEPDDNDRLCEEVLSKQPAQTGDYLWVKVAKTDVSSQQCRAALARATGVALDLVEMGGNRDRRGRCIQWFSIPAELVEHPASLRNAGYQGLVKVIEVTASHKPIGPASIARLRWRVRLRKAAAKDGYRLAMAVLDRLRTVGCPNYIGVSRLGKEGVYVKWGKMLLHGQRLPDVVREKGVNHGQCLFAYQASLFNRYLATRIERNALATVLSGDVVMTGQGRTERADDAEGYHKRLESWEVVQLGPLFGAEMPAAAGEALALEEAVLSDAAVTPEQALRLHGGRRAIRFQPAKPQCDIEKGDLIISCECPIDSYIAVVLEEIAKPERHFL
jgi:tRNA pseudouridine13 synthase